jgi:hypothetical protein
VCSLDVRANGTVHALPVRSTRRPRSQGKNGFPTGPSLPFSSHSVSVGIGTCTLENVELIHSSRRHLPPFLRILRLSRLLPRLLYGRSRASASVRVGRQDARSRHVRPHGRPDRPGYFPALLRHARMDEPVRRRGPFGRGLVSLSMLGMSCAQNESRADGADGRYS